MLYSLLYYSFLLKTWTDNVAAMCNLMEFVGISEKTLSLACTTLNVSALQKQSHLYAQITYAVAQVGNMCTMCIVQVSVCK